MRISGIYQIKSLINSNSYIGSSSNITCRWRQHKSQLNNGIHANKKMQHHINKYGKDVFEYIILQSDVKEDMLIEMEQFWMDKMNPEFNICRIAGRTTGVEYTEERKRKASMRLIGNKYAAGKTHSIPEDVRIKISNKLKGTRHSDESIKRQAEKMRGFRHSDESIAKMIRSQRGRSDRKIEAKQPYIANRNIKMNRGESVNTAKRTASEVMEIRKLFSEGRTAKEISCQMSIPRQTVYAIISRRTWNHI